MKALKVIGMALLVYFLLVVVSFVAGFISGMTGASMIVCYVGIMAVMSIIVALLISTLSKN